jgi:hypothetical protein
VRPMTDNGQKHAFDDNGQREKNAFNDRLTNVQRQPITQFQKLRETKGWDGAQGLTSTSSERAGGILSVCDLNCARRRGPANTCGQAPRGAVGAGGGAGLRASGAGGARFVRRAVRSQGGSVAGWDRDALLEQRGDELCARARVGAVGGRVGEGFGREREMRPIRTGKGERCASGLYWRGVGGTIELAALDEPRVHEQLRA